ncbi:MAG: hypothetical protein HXX16_12585 [Bacteroidales bacterium]|nr:hypothetical protein [Bacteroidales bacterium]
MKKNLLKQALVLSLMLICGLAFSQESTLLKYNFVKGKTYVITNQIESNMTQSMGGQQIKMKSDINSATEFLVEDVDKDGNTTILNSLLGVTVHSLMMGKDTTMKLDLKEQKRVVISSTGKQISSTLVGNASKFQMMGAESQIARIQILPGKEVIVGDKWHDTHADSSSITDNNPIATNSNVEMDYTFVGKETKDGVEYLKLTYSGTLTISGKGNMRGMDLFMEGNGKIEGFSYFDPKISLIVYSEGTTEMDMSIAMSGQQNMTMPMTQTLKNITKIEEKK